MTPARNPSSTVPFNTPSALETAENRVRGGKIKKVNRVARRLNDRRNLQNVRVPEKTLRTSHLFGATENLSTFRASDVRRARVYPASRLIFFALSLLGARDIAIGQPPQAWTTMSPQGRAQFRRNALISPALAPINASSRLWQEWDNFSVPGHQ